MTLLPFIFAKTTQVHPFNDRKIIILSPLDVAIRLKTRFMKRIHYARAEQMAFQNYLQALGIHRISNMNHQDVVKGYQPSMNS